MDQRRSRANFAGAVCPARWQRLSTIRSFFKFAYRVGLIRNDPAVMIWTSRGRGSEPSFLTVEESKRLLQVIEKGRSEFFRLRDYCIVSMILSTGARVSELTNADIGDLSLKNKTVKLHRKGGEQQTLPLSENLLSSLRRYMRVRKRRTRTRALFISTRDTRMSTSAVWKMIKGYCRKAKISKDRIGPHMLRHTLYVRDDPVDKRRKPQDDSGLDESQEHRHDVAVSPQP
jgi:site-specific recombinase XerD